MPVVSIFNLMSEDIWSLQLFILSWNNDSTCHLFPQHHYVIKVCLDTVGHIDSSGDILSRVISLRLDFSG